MNERRAHLSFLDLFRGVAIICVFLYHTLYQPFGRDQLDWSGWLRNFDAPASFLGLYPIAWGWCGVAIFFAVSGFCIHLSYAKAHQPSIAEFFIRRSFRIYPPFLVALVFFAFLFPYTRLNLHSHSGLGQLYSHLLLLHNLDSRTKHGIVVAWWSVAVEFQLYLLYPLLIVAARKLGWRGVLVCTAIIELGLRLGCDIYSLATHHAVPAFIDNSPFYFWFSWAVGAAIADAYIKGEALPFARSPPLLWVALLIAAELIKPLSAFSFTFASLATAAAIARLLPSGGHEIDENRHFGRRIILEHVRLAGMCSYSIYLIHHPIVEAWPRWLRLVLPTIDAYPLLMYVCCLASWLVILPVSWVMYRYVELPAIEMGKRVVKAWHKRHPVEKPTPDVA